MDTPTTITTVQPAPNPVGTVQQVAAINACVQKLIAEWQAIKVAAGAAWKSVEMHEAIQFLIQSLDALIVIAVNVGIPGPDKKATVLNALNNLYQYVVGPSIPIYLRPFSSAIENYVIYTVASNTIDWIVSKYESGAWGPPITLPAST